MVNVVVPSLWDSDDDSEDEQPAEPETIKSPDVVKQDDFHVLDDDGRPCKKRRAAATKGSRVTRLKGKAQIDLTIDDDEPAPTPSPSPAKPTARTASLQQPKSATEAPAAAQPLAPASVAELSKETRYNLERSQKLMASMSALQRDEVDLEEELSPGPAFVPRLVTRQHRYEPLPLPQQLQQPVVQPAAAGMQGGGSGSDAAAGLVTAAAAETEHKLQLHLKHKHGEFKVRIKPGDTCGRLLSVFLHLAAEKKVPCPTDPKAFKILFDGDKVEADQTIADLGLEEGDSLDVTWK